MRSRPGRARRACLLGAWLVAAAGPAAAEIYRCPGPDGTLRFASQPCAGAERFEPSAKLQRVERAAPAPEPRPIPARRGAAPAAVDEAARAARWKAKRRESEARLAEIGSALDEVGRAVAWCNQGREVYVTERDTGMRRELSCDRVRAEHDALEAERVQLRRYLDGGLEDECRRAGCLPGWIR